MLSISLFVSHAVYYVLQLVLNVAVSGHSVQGSPAASLPAATSVVNLADSHDRANFNMVAKMKEEPMDVETLENKEEVKVEAN